MCRIFLFEMSVTTSATPISDSNISNLYVKVISQRLINSLRDIPVFDLIVSKEKFINGAKQYFYHELPKSSDLDQEIEIKDFNPDQPKIKESVKTYQKATYISDKILIPALYRAFANPQVKSEYIDSKSRNLFNRMRLNLHELIIGSLLQSDKKLFTYTADKVIDTKVIKIGALDESENQRITRVLTLLRKEVESMKTPSKDRVKYVKANSLEIYHSAKIENLVLLVNSKFEADSAVLYSNLYNYDLLVPKSQKLVLDFSQYLPKADADKIDFLLIDKQAFINGTFIENISGELITPKFGRLLELTYTVGIHKIETYPVFKFASSV